MIYNCVIMQFVQQRAVTYLIPIKWSVYCYSALMFGVCSNERYPASSINLCHKYLMTRQTDRQTDRHIIPLLTQLLTKDINNLTQNIDLNMILLIHKLFKCFRWKTVCYRAAEIASVATVGQWWSLFTVKLCWYLLFSSRLFKLHFESFLFNVMNFSVIQLLVSLTFLSLCASALLSSSVLVFKSSGDSILYKYIKTNIRKTFYCFSEGVA